MQIPNYVTKIIATLQQAGYSAYLVGGCLRDHHLGKQPRDFDLATSAPPEVVLSLFPKTVPTGLKHGTVTVLSPEGACEVTTFRTDGPYEHRRRPEYVRFTQSIEEDLARRDFTINAIAYDGQHYVDPFQGLADLNGRMIRAVGDPVERFQEDALRMLRAVRFAAQLDFKIEPKTKAAIKGHTYLLHSVSVERIRDELTKLLLSQLPGYGLLLLNELGLCAWIIPELQELEGLRERISIIESTPANLVIRLAGLLNFADSSADNIVTKESGLLPSQVLRRLKYDRKTITQVSLLLKEQDKEWLNNSPIELKKFIRRIGLNNVNPFFELQLARAKAHQPHAVECSKKAVTLHFSEEEIKTMWAKVNKLIQEKQPIFLHDLALTGQDILDLGIEEGPRIGQILEHLLEKVLVDKALNKRDILLRLAEEMIKPVNR